MNLLFRVIYSAHCRGTHHKLAMDGLRLIQLPDAERWQNLLLSHHEMFLTGSKEPDDQFKDFTNHVLHVAPAGQADWGGAPAAAEKWFYNTVRSLQNGDWDHAARAAGILSHYLVDPIMPFHTGQSTAENNIHRACEWSISQSYDSLLQTSLRRSPPIIPIHSNAHWLSDLVTASARMAHEHYQTLLRHYDFHAGVRNPRAGLDDTAQEIVAHLLQYAAGAWARVLERALIESRVRPPHVETHWPTLLATLDVPIKWITHRLADRADRAAVQAIYDELQSTGSVEQHLPEESRVIRRESPANANRSAAGPIPREPAPKAPRELYAPSSTTDARRDERIDLTSPTPTIPRPPVVREVVRIPADPALTHLALPSSAPSLPAPTRESIEMTPTRNIEPSSPRARHHLEPESDIVDAPSIGPKMAQRLRDIGISKVVDLLENEPATIADLLGLKHVTSDVITQWIDQARLMIEVPVLRGHDAQLLVATGYRTRPELAVGQVDEMLRQFREFLATPAAERLLRSTKAPERAELETWRRHAAEQQPRQAA